MTRDTSFFCPLFADMLKIFAYFASLNYNILLMTKKTESMSACWQIFLAATTTGHIRR